MGRLVDTEIDFDNGGAWDAANCEDLPGEDDCGLGRHLLKDVEDCLRG